jgi:hypothetical protein
MQMNTITPKLRELTESLLPKILSSVKGLNMSAVVVAPNKERLAEGEAEFAKLGLDGKLQLHYLLPTSLTATRLRGRTRLFAVVEGCELPDEPRATIMRSLMSTAMFAECNAESLLFQL